MKHSGGIMKHDVSCQEVTLYRFVPSHCDDCLWLFLLVIFQLLQKKERYDKYTDMREQAREP